MRGSWCTTVIAAMRMIAQASLALVSDIEARATHIRPFSILDAGCERKDCLSAFNPVHRMLLFDLPAVGVAQTLEQVHQRTKLLPEIRPVSCKSNDVLHHSKGCALVIFGKVYGKSGGLG